MINSAFASTASATIEDVTSTVKKILVTGTPRDPTARPTTSQSIAAVLGYS
jgi:hypothetical protein